MKINVGGNHLMVGLLGERDEYLRVIEDRFDAQVNVRGNEISIEGPDASEAARVIEELILIVERGQEIERSSVRRAIDMVANHQRPSEVLTDRILTTDRGKAVRPKTSGQKLYLDAI